MAKIHRPIRWAQQPDIPVGIDWANPIARGLIHCVVGQSAGAPRSLVNATSATLVPDTVRGIGFYGREWQGPGVDPGTGNGADILDVLGLGGYATGPFTVFSIAHCDGQTPKDAFQGIFALGPGTNLGFSGSIRSSIPSVYFRTWNGASYDQVTSSGPLALGKPYRVAGVHRGSTNEVWVEGEPTSAPCSARAINNNTNSHWGIDGIFNGSGLKGGIAFGAVWGRGLSAAELRSLTDNPWQIFAPLHRRLSWGQILFRGVHLANETLTTPSIASEILAAPSVASESLTTPTIVSENLE